MKKQSLLLALMAVSSATVFAGPPIDSHPGSKVPADAITTRTEVSRWSISAGAVFREIEGDFELRSPGPLATPRSVSGRGDVGLQRGGANVVTYDDGSVGPGWGIFDGFGPPDGTSYGTINSGGQVTQRGVDEFGFPIYNVAFHTDRTFYRSQYNSTPFHSSDDEVGVGPFVELRYAAITNPNLDVNVVLGYSWVSAELGSGTGVLATQTLQRVTDRYTYNYDFAGDLTGATFPFVDDGGLFITNPNGDFNTFANGVYSGPRSSRSRSAQNVAQYVLLGHADLDVDLHEIVLAPEVMFNVCNNRVRIGLSVGPTVNFINSDFDATASWYKRGSSRPIKTFNAHESSNDVEVGVASQLTLMVDITRRFFFQASGSYRYVPDVDVHTSFGSATIDTTAWQGAVGFGIRL